MILRLVIADGRQTPAVAESVELSADGTLTGWRSVSPAGVGWFTGKLPAPELTALQALIEAVTPTSPPHPVPRPGAAEEVLELPATGPVSIAGLTPASAPAPTPASAPADADSLDGGVDGAGAWARLAEASRQLIERLTDFPRAAVAVDVASPTTARLVHRGTDPLRLDLGTVAVRVTAWRGYYEPAGDWTGPVTGPAEVEAGPGWTYDLPIERAPDDTTVHLAVNFAVLSGSTKVPVQARFTPVPK
ncbi:hypothetical protein GCM10010172_46960 [Paractinoplanes ferrugineus]|uniref:Uncharacterized protein n=1 Tax=Paractinoplanes ferrugineus TaxID=113564 RepID=A0A919IXI5_9ACTN|nr:hypothetical protein [Actinoplanes ferrugineus]GIE10280.1 hypothetical protein Afe05nite_21200 [Actinoplanes ferrugineus]